MRKPNPISAAVEPLEREGQDFSAAEVARTPEQERFGRTLTEGEREAVAATQPKTEVPAGLVELPRWLVSMEKHGFPKMRREIQAETRQAAVVEFMRLEGIVDCGDKIPTAQRLGEGQEGAKGKADAEGNAGGKVRGKGQGQGRGRQPVRRLSAGDGAIAPDGQGAGAEETQVAVG